MGWMHYFGRSFNLRGLFRASPFYPEDFEYLPIQACEKLLDKMRKSI